MKKGYSYGWLLVVPLYMNISLHSAIHVILEIHYTYFKNDLTLNSIHIDIFVNTELSLLAFVADMLSDSGRLFPSIAFMTECPVCVLDKATISKAATADFATKASRMPAFVHSFDHPTDDEFVAFSTGRRIQHVEIVFTVFSALELRRHSEMRKLISILNNC